MTTPSLYNSGWNGFLTEHSRGFDNGVQELDTLMQTALDELEDNPSDPVKLAAYQSALGDYTMYRNLQSNSVKAYKDISAAIIANFR
jgi:type III secretion protein F